MKQKHCLRKIYKLHSKQLKKAKWKLNMPLEEALLKMPESVVTLNSSQALRFIDDILGIENIDARIANVKRQIKDIKKQPKCKKNRDTVIALYKELYSLEFQPHYLCVIMDTNADYDRANKGFSINGIKYRRLLGTNGGIKNSTITYVSEQVYPELKRRIDNGRDMTKKLIPAKLEAYQALACSGSTPLPEPNGIIIVKDCVTHFKEDVILIDDSSDGEPVLTYEDDYEIEHNDSDGFGLMLPQYSRRVNEYLTGDGEHTIAGMNSRLAWEKGMIYTFDFVEFAEKIAGTYEIVDAWGTKRDVRDAEVIMPTSMLKLWDSYPSWEEYWQNCKENGYQLSSPKTTPSKLENVRTTNYQFLQPYDFSDEELEALCKPTVDEVKDALGMDYRKSIVFMCGLGLTPKNALDGDFSYCAKALMADKRMINDPFIRSRIWNMIEKTVRDAKKGKIIVDGNYSMISGDPYALCQSMFGMEVTGLLQAGEIYHRYWLDKGADEVSCFRAPMTAANNIVRMKLASREEIEYWYRFMDTVAILNAWDTTCDAMNGADKDGDTTFITDNPIIVRNTERLRTIMCVQKSAAKIVPTEEAIIESNKLAFNDDIGKITNYVTSMIERRAGFEKGSKEYEILTYRIMSGEKYQQDSIDRAKGIVSRPMPGYWYNIHECIPREEDDDDTVAFKRENKKIVAANKPYFMTYVYPSLRKEYRAYMKAYNFDVADEFGELGIRNVKGLYEMHFKPTAVKEYLKEFEKRLPVGMNPCVVNRMAWLFEREFDGYLKKVNANVDFDYTIMKSGAHYTKADALRIKEIYDKHCEKLSEFKYAELLGNISSDWVEVYHESCERFMRECAEICPNEDELCDIVLDICYGNEHSKQFAWDVCGDKIIENLMTANGNVVSIPVRVEDGGDFSFRGEQFILVEHSYGNGEELEDNKRV